MVQVQISQAVAKLFAVFFFIPTPDFCRFRDCVHDGSQYSGNILIIILYDCAGYTIVLTFDCYSNVILLLSGIRIQCVP